jgi:hypothetical protein
MNIFDPENRVARWYMYFNTKMSTLLYVFWEGKCRYISTYVCLLLFLVLFWYMFWPFGIFGGNFGIFSRFGQLCREKSGNPALEMFKCSSFREIFFLFNFFDFFSMKRLQRAFVHSLFLHSFAYECISIKVLRSLEMQRNGIFMLWIPRLRM